MTVKTTLSFTDRHAAFLEEKVAKGAYASKSAAVAQAVEALMREEAMIEAALEAEVEKIKRRLETPREEYITVEEAFGRARERIRQQDKKSA